MTIATANPGVSIIINTLDRAGPLLTLLRALEHQSYPHFEVVVVVGPTRDDTLAALEPYRERIRIAHCPTVNLSQSRNIGLREARGELVAFVDDDAVPCQRWLEQFVRILAAPYIDVTGGAVWAAHPRFSMLQYRLGIYSSLAEQSDVRASWADQVVPPGMATRWIARAPGGNLAARRQALLEAGGFDEFFEFVAEETDLALRMVKAGRTVLPVLEAPIYHFPATGRNRVAFTNKGRWWMRCRSRVYLGVRHGLSDGESLRAVVARSFRSAAANHPWYFRLLLDRQYSPLEYLRMATSEVGAALSGLAHALFSAPRLIPADALQATAGQMQGGDLPEDPLHLPPGPLPEGRGEAEDGARILRFQTPDSPFQPAVDPVSGRTGSGYYPAPTSGSVPTCGPTPTNEIAPTDEPAPTNTNIPEARPALISMPEPSLRLCLLSNTYPPASFGGIARLTHLMAQGLFELGHSVHVITRGEREDVTFYDGAYVHRIPNLLKRYEAYRGLPDLYATLNYSHNVYDKVQRLVLNDGIQLVDSPIWQYEGLVTLQSGIAPVVIRLVTGLRQISQIHRRQVDEFRLMGDLEQAFIEQADYLLPNTQATLEAMRKVYRFPDSQRLKVVSYGIVPAPEEETRPFDLQASKETLNVLFVGRQEKRKGILDLFEAIPAVLKAIPQARFIIAGADNSQHDGFLMKTGLTYQAYFNERYKEYLPAVQFTGQVSDEELNRLYRACDLFVAPSVYESFGLIYIEAMNYAKPVIGCRAGGIPEVVEHEVTGLLVDPEAPRQLAEAIVSMLKSPARLREFGLAGRAQVLQRFNYLEMARNYARIYREVIAEAGAR